MRNTIIWLLAAVLVTGLLFNGSLWATKKEFKVAVKLERVERNPPLVSPAKVQNGNVFDSPPMAVAWAPAPQGFRFRIYNKTNSDITILWNECMFIDENGNRHKISHKDVQRGSMDDMKVMKPTVVRAGDNWQDVFFPFTSDYIKQEKELVGFSPGAGASSVDTYGKAGLRIKPIFVDSYKEKQVKKITKKNLKKDKDFTFNAYINSHTYAIEMALEIDSQKYVYTFFFRALLL